MKEFAHRSSGSWRYGWRFLPLLLLAFVCTACQAQESAPAASVDPGFGQLVAQLSEPGGYFDTDNLISNESSYLHVIGGLEKHGVEGGAYIGVGPDQNYSYIAHTAPSIAFLIDIRRDNLLLHLLFKALFVEAPDRATYLALLFGRPLPEAGSMDAATAAELASHIESLPPISDAEARIEKMARRAASFGVAITDEELERMAGFYREFIESGIDLRFRSHNRSPQPYYPTYRRLMLEQDLEGRQSNYLAQEEWYQVVRTLHLENRIIPVVGDLSGEHALRAIGDYLRDIGEEVTLVYTSNVEFYLMYDRRFEDYMANVAHLPHSDEGVLVRSFFNRFRMNHPQTRPGYASTQLMQSLDSFVEQYQAGGGYNSYFDLVTKHVIDLP